MGMKKMLEGIRVIDLSRNLAAPFCTMTLADLGAEVIKVEMPETGDDARGYGPIINGESGYFMSVNRGKKGVTINLKEQKGKEMLTKLLEKADVMVDNFRPGVLDRLGFSEENLRKINPRLICASLTGFGHTGPYREKAAYDLVVQGYGGIMSVTGQEGGPPTRVGVSIGDLAAGLYLTIGIIGSLLAREKTGRGDRIDVAMLDCQVALLENSIIRYIASGEVPKPVGNRHPSITPFEVLPSKDGYITVCVGNEKNWKIFCQVLEHPELITDPRFLDNDLRTENHAVLSSILGEIMRTQTTKEWIAKLDEAGVPCGSVNNIKDVLEDEQVKARNMIISIDYPKVGTIQAPGCPIKSREYPVQTYKPSPFLGQDNEEIFKGLGFSEEDLKCLKKDKII